jgi:hypothetical protein
LDAALWAEKKEIQDHRLLKDERNLVLQLRWAWLTSLVYECELNKVLEDGMREALFQYDL